MRNELVKRSLLNSSPTEGELTTHGSTVEAETRAVGVSDAGDDASPSGPRREHRRHRAPPASHLQDALSTAKVSWRARPSRATAEQFGWGHQMACRADNVLHVAELLTWRVQQLVLQAQGLSTEVIPFRAGFFALRGSHRIRPTGRHAGLRGVMQHSPDQMRTVAITTNVGAGSRLHFLCDSDPRR